MITSGILITYGEPNGSTIFAKEAAINMAQNAKEQGKIIDYHIEEESETTGKIIARMETTQ